MESLHEPAWLAEPDTGRILRANAAAQRLHQASGTLGALMMGVGAPEGWRTRADHAIETGFAQFTTVHGRAATLSLLPLDRLYLLARESAPEAAALPPHDLLSIVGLLPDVVFRCEKGQDGRIYWSLNEGGLAKEFHLTTAEIRGRPLDELFPLPGGAAVQANFEAAFNGDAQEFVNEIAGRYFRHFPQPIRGPDGRVTMVVGFITEVTQLVKAERQVQELNAQLVARMAELNAANDDLRAFGTALGHDLRRPLTVIENYRQLLQRFHNANLDPEAQQCLARIGGAVESANQLIEDVLNLTEATRAPMAPQGIDLSTLARAIGAELQTGDPGRTVALHVQDGLRTRGDPRLVRMGLANLLHNAWKFTSKAPAARIDVGGGPDGFWVRDNGVGFDMARAQSLFSPFTRLHDRKDFPGTGLGLSIVERIVRRHGGQVWAEARPGHGATFHVSLPEAAP